MTDEECFPWVLTGGLLIEVQRGLVPTSLEKLLESVNIKGLKIVIPTISLTTAS